jgi:hypothetical protein
LIPIGISLIVGASTDESIVDRFDENMGLTLKTGVHIKALKAELGTAKRLIIGGALRAKVWCGTCETVDRWAVEVSDGWIKECVLVGGVWQEENSSRVDRSKRRLGIKYMLINEKNN